MLLPGLVWSMEGRPCSMSALAGVAVWGTGRVATHTGRGWMGGLVLRMVLAFNVAELGLRETERDKEARRQRLKRRRLTEAAAALTGQTGTSRLFG